jgi:xanthine dehydrogenase YagR molybdenum-binding subunit
LAATATAPRNENRTVAYRSFGAHFCEVRVNRWTAEPRVSRWLTVIDAGQIVNAKTARSQIVGGMTMGIGNAAVASAVHNATGTRVRELPITLDKLLG